MKIPECCGEIEFCKAIFSMRVPEGTPEYLERNEEMVTVRGFTFLKFSNLTEGKHLQIDVDD